MLEQKITRGYLKAHPNEVFVFGDNTERWGKGGAAALRDCRNVYGFVTQKRPSHDANAHYKPEEFLLIYENEVRKLKKEIEKNPELTYLISRVGGGLANRFHIWEKIIEPRIRKDFGNYTNVKFLWED